MSEADERRYAYEAQQRSPKPEPTFEYRVVCADGEWRWSGSFIDYDAALASVGRARACRGLGGVHEHMVERRSVGPWERT